MSQQKAKFPLRFLISLNNLSNQKPKRVDLFIFEKSPSL